MKKLDGRSVLARDCFWYTENRVFWILANRHDTERRDGKTLTCTAGPVTPYCRCLDVPAKAREFFYPLRGRAET